MRAGPGSPASDRAESGAAPGSILRDGWGSANPHRSGAAAPAGALPALRAVLIALALLALAATGFPAHVLGAEDPPPMSNDDVLLLAKAGLGEAVIVAKIRSARQVAFRLEVEDLDALQKAGVPDAAVEAMFDRAGGGPPSRGPESPGRRWEGKVFLVTSEGEVPLEADPAHGVARLKWNLRLSTEHPGQAAAARVPSGPVTLHVRADASPLASFALVQAEVDPEDGVRVVAVTNPDPLSPTRAPDPAPIDTIRCAERKVSDGTWEITPYGHLAPGEYGLYVIEMKRRQGGAAIPAAPSAGLLTTPGRTFLLETLQDAFVGWLWGFGVD